MSEQNARLERTIADVLASGETLEPLVVYGVFADWANKTVDACRFIQKEVINRAAKGTAITPAVQQHVFNMVRELLEDLRTDLNLLITAPYKHVLRKVYEADAREMIAHADVVLSSLSEAQTPKVIAHVLDQSIATHLLAIIDQTYTAFIENYEENKAKVEHAKKIGFETQRHAEEELARALAQFTYKTQAVRAKEKTLVGV